ncbi:MAG: lptC [Rhodospirillales bacterium]|nr:lptC [Rhodospirillales bacterium]
MAANPPSAPSEEPHDPSDRLRNLSALQRQSAYAPAYTRLVRRLRVLLPVVGVLTVAIVILWPRIRAEFNHPTETTQEDRQARMVNGRYVGSDSHGRPYTVTYESAQQPPGGGPIEMVNPTAELTLQNGHWVALKAEHGHYDQAAGLIDLSGHVEFFHDEGYRFVTERAHVEFNKNLAWGERAITGHGPKGEVAGRGFRLINNGEAVVITGPARLLLRPDAAQMPAPGETR